MSEVPVADIPLRDFRSTSANLSRNEQISIVGQASRVLKSLYVHGFEDSSGHFGSALSQLLKLETQVTQGIDERSFHDEMIAAFRLLRDGHTHYLLPQVFRGRIAYLPLVISDYFDNGTRKYCASFVNSTKVQDSQFVSGVDVTHWNGTPIDVIVQRIARDENGAHPAAQSARAVASLTMRPTWLLPLPVDDEVTLEYVASAGIRKTTLKWSVTTLQESTDDFRLLSTVDVQGRAILQLKAALFPEVQTKPDSPIGKAISVDNVGYYRLANFFFGDEPFVTDFASFLKSQPSSGLIIDTRGNPGGYLPAGERSLQLFGRGETIEPVSWEFRTTPEALALCRAVSEAPHLSPAERQQFSDYIPSLEEALELGQPTSASLQATSRQDANNVGAVYHGPVVLLTDALTYSVGDVFAAGFQDHGLGAILGIDEATGGGGSNDVAYETISKLLPNTFPSLPRGASFRISLRRCRRVRTHAGVLIEKFGVSANELHRVTRNDRMADDKDLLNRARTLACLKL